MAKASKSAAKKGSGKRELIAPKGDKRYIKRDAKGRIKESDDQGRSLSQDKKKTAKKKVKSGYGDQGDQEKKSPASKKKSAPAKKKSAPAKKKSSPAKKKSAPKKAAAGKKAARKK
jgi:hypothetical protein